MNLNKNTAIFKLYAACYIMSKKLFGATPDRLTFHSRVDVPTQTNLCSLMRTVLLWTPIYLILLISVTAGLVYTVLVAPSLFGGLSGYFNLYIIPSCVIAVFVGAVWLIHLFMDKNTSKPETWAEKEARHEAGNYTIWETFCHWVEALHDKTCPLITVVDEPVAPKPTAPTSVEQASNDGNKEIETIIDDIVKSKKASEQSQDNEKTTDTIEAVSPDSTKNGSYVQDVKLYDDAGNYVPDPVEEGPSKVMWFMIDYLPNFQIFLAAGVAIVVLLLVNLFMAVVMQHNPVVYEKAACVGTFNTKTQQANIKCGKYSHEPKHGLDFVTNVILLKKTPYCSVRKGTYLDDVDFKCEYKDSK